MTSPAFPEEILGRSILRDGFSYKRAEGVERTPMDSGLARGRLFNANPTARVPVLFVWTETEISFFEVWLQQVAQRGAAWFTIYLPLEGGSYRQVLARVADVPPRTPRDATAMTVPLELEVHDQSVLPDGIADLILALGLTGAQDMDAALEDTSLQPFFDEWAADFAA